MRYDSSMIQWLRERRFMLLFVGVAVPLMFAIGFWRVIRPDWPFWVACYVVGFPGGVLVAWGRQRLSGSWTRLRKPQRILLRCLAVAALWSWLVLLPDNRSDRFLDATAITTAVLLLWGGYAVFSRVIDRLWLRIRRQ
jgi:hypothetical protein